MNKTIYNVGDEYIPDLCVSVVACLTNLRVYGENRILKKRSCRYLNSCAGVCGEYICSSKNLGICQLKLL